MSGLVVAIAIVVIAAADLVLLVLLRRKNLGDTTWQPPDYRLLRLLMMVGWVWYTLPGLVERLTVGRDDIPLVGNTPTLSATAMQLHWILGGAFLVVAVVAAVHYARGNVGGRGALLVVALLPWATIGAIAFAHSQHAQVLVACCPLVVVAIWGARPPIRVFATLGWLTVLTAALAVIMGLASDAGTLTTDAFVDKFGWTALAGPFTHPNMLGSVLALGLPTVLVIRSRPVVVVSVVLVCWAIAWSSSRSAMATAAVVVVVSLVVPRFARSALARRVVVWSTVALGVGLMWWLPWHATEASAFNYRGRVWIGSIHRWNDAPWFGGGPDAYLAPGQYRTWLGEYAYHGHNALVDALVVGGLAVAAALAVLVVTLTARAAEAFATGSTFAYGVVAAFVVEGVLEVSTNFWLPSSTSLVAWFTISAALFARPSCGTAETLDSMLREASRGVSRLRMPMGSSGAPETSPSPVRP